MRRWLLAICGVVVIGLLVSIVVRAFAVDVYAVDQNSMAPTLQDGERILVTKNYPNSEGVQRGDIVVFDGEGSFTPYQGGPSLTHMVETLGQWVGLGTAPDVYVKRVIGAEGDLVACCDDAGRLVINGEPDLEPYLAESVSAQSPASELNFESQVPQGRFWVMGDNREDSVDSRDLLGAPGGGMISEDRIIGRAHSVIWPWDDRRNLEGDGH